MTSPHASPAEGDPPPATVALDDNTPNQLELTAALHIEQEAAEPQKQAPPETMLADESEVVKDEAQDENVQKPAPEQPGAIDEAAIPGGAEALHDIQDAFSAGPLNGLARLPLDVFNPAMPQQPMSMYDSIDGLPYPSDPAQGAEGLLALQMAMNASANQNPYLDQAPYSHDLDETRISAFAKLEFEDGEFYMNTHQVILGRDLTAARAAMRRDEEQVKHKFEDETSGAAPLTPVQGKRTESKYTKSLVSESGGILREGDDSDPETRRKRRSRKASKKSKSTGSSSHDQSRRNSIQQNGLVTYQAQSQVRRSAPETAGAVPVDPASLRPSPHDCPLVGIHPPAITPASGYKAISRKHVKIAYNSEKHLFEAHIIGRNGAFVDDEFRYYNDVIQLKSGSRLQIGGVVVRFVLPDVAIGETGAEQKADYEENVFTDRYSEGGKEMSFDFEDTPRDGVILEETSEDEFEEEVGDDLDDDQDEEDLDGEEGEGHENGDMSGLDEMDEDEDEDERNKTATLPNPQTRPEKKRGPGRPPKNGIMSKREQQLVKKEALAQAQAQQKAQKSLPQAAGPVPGKNKVGRPRKHPKQPTPEIQREKRKYTKRKPKEPKDPNVKQEGSGDDQPVKEKKEKKEKPPKPPRSPSPTFNEADLTPEQLAKPQANYVSLIFDALSNSPTGQMSLPQIYRAIMRKYPFFVLKTTTNGWQSSVRHNLSQHHAFRKVERDGKGWMWAIVDGSTIEKEKKKKASPPPQLTPGHMHHQQILQAGHPPHMMPGHPYGPGMMGPPGYPISHPIPPGMHPGQPPQYMPAPHQLHGPPPPVGSLPHAPGLPPPGFPPSVPPQLVAPSSGTYSSPYAPKPNPPSASQPQANDQRLITEPRPPVQAANTAPTPQQQYRQQQPPPQPPPAQQPAQNPPPGPAPPNEKVLKFLETFKTTVIKTLKEKTSNAEAIVSSAVNRTLGITTESTVPGNTHEDMLISILRNSLSQIPDSNVKPNPPQPGSSNSQPSEQRPAQPSPANQSEPQGNAKAAGPTVMRPSFTGQSQNRSSTTSVSRPPMMTPGIKRTASGSPANAPARLSAPSSASPAPPPSTANGASTPAAAIAEPGQVAGQKRPHEDGDDMRDLKRLSTSGPPPVKT